MYPAVSLASFKSFLDASTLPLSDDLDEKAQPE